MQLTVLRNELVNRFLINFLLQPGLQQVPAGAIPGMRQRIPFAVEHHVDVNTVSRSNYNVMYAFICHYLIVGFFCSFAGLSPINPKKTIEIINSRMYL